MEEARCLVCGAMIGLSFMGCAVTGTDVCSDECRAIYYDEDEDDISLNQTIEQPKEEIAGGKHE